MFISVTAVAKGNSVAVTNVATVAAINHVVVFNKTTFADVYVAAVAVIMQFCSGSNCQCCPS